MDKPLYNRAAVMDQKKKKKTGRPAKITGPVIDKLDYAYSIGCSDPEAATYAGVSLSCLYRYLNDHPEYRDRREALKKKPVLEARETVLQSIRSGDPVTAKWYLEKQAPEDFGSRAELTVNHAGGLTIEDRREALSAFLSRFTE